MSECEYGHSGGIVGRGGFIDSWGHGPLIIEVDGKTFRFEDSDRFGPVPLNADDEPSAKAWFGQRSPFWRGWKLWVAQGRRTAKGTKAETCLWDEVDDYASARPT